MEAHHPYPKQFRPFFEGKVNWRETEMISQSAHRLKPNGLHTGSENVNKLWDQFFKEYGKNATPEMIRQHRDWIDYLKSK